MCDYMTDPRMTGCSGSVGPATDRASSLISAHGLPVVNSQSIFRLFLQVKYDCFFLLTTPAFFVALTYTSKTILHLHDWCVYVCNSSSFKRLDFIFQRFPAEPDRR